MSQATPKVKVCVRLDPDTHEKLQAVSRQEGIKVTTLVYRAIYKEYGLSNAQRGLCLSIGQMGQKDEQGAAEHAHDPFLS